MARNFDTIIAGAGILGLSLALELAGRGAKVLVLERNRALSHASSAAAGMLAVDDPHNPLTLLPLSKYSRSLYPAYLARLESLSQHSVPVQTRGTIQHHDDGTPTFLPEWSIDPRMLAAALRSAVQHTTIELREHAEVRLLAEAPHGQQAVLLDGTRLACNRLVLATGAWGLPESISSASGTPYPNPVQPSKGQMLRVALPPSLTGLDLVYRRGSFYIVPRTQGPQAGTALLGATIEDAGFDTTVREHSLLALRAQAANLLSPFADAHAAPAVESWAGLRPSTADGLPLLGELSPEGPIAALGAGRNGILLAPAIARILADLIEAKPSAVDLTPFSPQRFPHPELVQHVPV